MNTIIDPALSGGLNLALPLAGKKGLITGIANDKSIAFAVAKAIVALGGEVALTYQNDKTAKYTQPLAEALGAKLFEKLDVAEPGSLEGVIAKCGETFGNMQFRFAAETTQSATVARAKADGARTFEKTLEAQFLAVSGVSIDEEVVRLISYQRNFQAAARFISIVNSLLETLINL